MSWEAEAQAKVEQGYRLKELPHTCAHCANLKFTCQTVCSIGRFPVVPLGTCNFWTSRKNHNEKPKRY